MTGTVALGRAHGQVALPPAPPPVATADLPPDDNATGGLPLSVVVKKMSKAANVQIVADSASSGVVVTSPNSKTTPANFEAQIDKLVSQLPSGATWAKLYLPDVTGRAYNGDDLADYAVAESKVFGGVGGALPPGTVEVLGQKLAPDKSAQVIAALNLKPIYLIANPSPVKNTGGMTQQQWNALTPEQKQQFAQGQAQLLLSLDPAQRGQAMMQMFGQATAVANAMFQSLPAAEQRQFVQGMLGALGLGAGLQGRSAGGTPPL